MEADTTGDARTVAPTRLRTALSFLAGPLRSDGLIGALFSSEPTVPGDDPTLQQLLMLAAIFCGPV
ncbi:hypothetical protein GNI_142410, partial [Gregarina niphandrodes]